MSRLTLLLLVSLAGCTVSDILNGGATVKTSSWLETGEVRKSREDVARTVREQLVRLGYPPTEFVDDHLETPWDVHLSPRYREGYRTKVEAEILTLGPGAFNVRVRSTMEINNSQTEGGSEKADWIGAGASEKHKAHIADEAVKLNSTLKLRFFGLNP
ncbi:MAG TPA: hypothetical protein VNM14_18830 [Planctomycetota bacterium]|jgi:hypothetical protein|nr:hypothetical protein [Planctomycetota bacterium]